MSGKYKRKTRDVPIIPVAEPDWPKLLYNLKRQGYPFAALARELGMTREMMYSVLKGRSAPSWSAGEQIITLGDIEQ